MDVVIHAGAHITDEDRLINCLLQNQTALSAQGILVPKPQHYRKLLRDQINKPKRIPLAETAADVVQNALLQDVTATRLILSNSSFFGTAKMAVSADTLYAAAVTRLTKLQGVFEGHRLSFYMAICNPATFLPAVFNKAPTHSFDDYMSGVDPRVLRWSELIERIRAAFPQMPITVWCNEDLPLIWSDLIRALGGLKPETPFEGEFSFLEEIMSEAGFQRFQSYLASHPGMSESQKRRVIMAFLDKFAREDAIEEEVSIHGWTDTLIEELTAGYDQDLLAIQAIPQIELIAP